MYVSVVVSVAEVVVVAYLMINNPFRVYTERRRHDGVAFMMHVEVRV